MRRVISALLATAPIAIASQTVFSVHDDLLAFPQYNVVFSDSHISEQDVISILDGDYSAFGDLPSINTMDIESASSSATPPAKPHTYDPEHETYEIMTLRGEPYFCTIPIVETPLRNETSEVEAKAAEQKELARATDRGWELLQELDGHCLYFVSGWWSYAFCYNKDITQFHQLPPQPGKPMLPPQRDPNTKQFVLGRAKDKSSEGQETGSDVDVRKPKDGQPKTELQIKGDNKYLVQKMEGGTTCDLTGKPRKVEIQYHCNPHVTDRIGYIKEITTCSYLLVIYTPRLCNDVAFMPQKENTANSIVCRSVVSEASVPQGDVLKTTETELDSSSTLKEKPIYVGGLVLGGGKWMNKEGQRMPIPANFGQDPATKQSDVIARAKSKAEGGQVEMVSDTELRKMDLDPEMVDKLKKEIQKMAQEKGWKIEVVDEPGQIREILGIVDGEDDEDDEGSEETFYKDEL